MLPIPLLFSIPLLCAFSSGGSFPKPLSKEEEQQLLLRLQNGTKTQKEAAKQTLILHNLRLVAHIAKKYNNTQREPEELISIGIVGLIKAILSYDNEKSIRLATYAKPGQRFKSIPLYRMGIVPPLQQAVMYFVSV